MSEQKTITRSDLLKAGGALALGAVTVGVVPKALKATAAAQSQYGHEGPRNAMVIDLRKCIGCRGCTVTCKSENNVPLDVWRTVVKEDWRETGDIAEKHFMPRMCNHCEGTIKQSDGAYYPPCVNGCPRKDLRTETWNGIEYKHGATFKRPDGTIGYDSSECIACYACISNCPYGARHVNKFVTPGGPNPINPVGIGKCTFCMHRIDNGVVPACVNTCTGRARVFGDLKDPNSEVSQLLSSYDTVTLLPGENTLPQVFYIDPENVLSSYQKGEPFRDKIV